MMIYCIEDDISIRELIIYTLKLSGFEAKGFETGDELFAEMEKEVPELIMLDIMLPGQDGLSILKQLKNDQRYHDIPVIMATAKGTEYDVVNGLDLGADDYLSKPFGMMEMVSRVKAVLRRGSNKDVNNIICIKDLVIDKKKRTVKINDEKIDLTLKEFELLQLLCENKGIVFDRQNLLEKIWGMDYLGESRTIDVHIGTLRNKLGEYGKMIRTVHGVGYSLEE